MFDSCNSVRAEPLIQSLQTSAKARMRRLGDKLQKMGKKTGVLQLTGASLYLLDPRAGRQSMTCKYCSAKTQQHTTREVRIIAAIGAVVVHRRAVLRSAEPGVTPLQDLGQLI